MSFGRLVAVVLAVLLFAPAAAAAEDTVTKKVPSGAPAPGPLAAPLRLERIEPTPELLWRWRRFSTADYVLTGATALGSLPMVIFKSPPSVLPARVGFDESARDAIRLRTAAGRDVARDASDVLLTINTTFPLFVDALAVAYWQRKSNDVAFQMAAIDLEALAVNSFIYTTVSFVMGRERPFGRLCPSDPLLQNGDCASNSRYRAYFSGHSSTSFASAGVTCTHHTHIPLYGGGVRDVIPCVLSVAAAATTAALRVLADYHYLSDVLTGAAVGTFSGAFIPWVLHYRVGAPAKADDRPKKPAAVNWTFAPAPLGVAVLGTF